MSRLVPVNDYFMIELESNQYGFTGGKKVEEGIESGRVVSISEAPTYFGMSTFAFDSSMFDEGLLKKAHDHYKQFVGKRVYWPAFNERGAVIDFEGKQYAFLKWSALMGVLEDETNEENA